MFKTEREMSPEDRRQAAKDRQARRQKPLEAMARLAGGNNWSHIFTALKNGEVEFPRKPQQQ